MNVFQPKRMKYHAISMNEPWKHANKLIKPDTKGHILTNSISIKCPE